MDARKASESPSLYTRETRRGASMETPKKISRMATTFRTWRMDMGWRRYSAKRLST